MDYNLEAKVLNCKKQIRSNNEQISKLVDDNNRLLNSLLGMLSIGVISDEQKARYDRELASDAWKNTDYYKNKSMFRQLD